MTKKLVLLLAGVCAGFPLMGQGAPVHSTISYRIKADRLTEWQDLRRQVVDIFKKAGIEHAQGVYLRLSGPYEIAIVRQYAKWQDLEVQIQQDPKLKDSLAQLTALNSRMLACVESGSRDLGRVSELSYGMKEEPAPMVQVIRTTVKPGMGNEYMNLVKSEVVPAYKKAGIKTFVLITPAYGEGDVVSVIPRSWKDIDAGQPLAKALGQEGYAALLKKLNAMTVKRQIDLYQYRPGMSYRPGAAGTPSGGK